jgi:hypothetical protein
LGIGQQAISGVASIVARDATAVVPVQAAEISRVLAKRLFTSIDTVVAEETAKDYGLVYQKNASLLPDEAMRADFKERLIAHYPFHPTLIDFLNNKLATSENFQGTRGVLRVLALAVRNIWNKQSKIPMIHSCHLDLEDARTVNEIVSRTGSGGLLPILNADIGGPDTEGIEGGRSNAEIADKRNPHPDGWPMYQYTWKTVFLHSLVGRDQGLESNLFGLSEQDALFHVTFPELTPPQVAEALKEISDSAFYLRFDQGRYYASLDPSINIALARIRRTLSMTEINQMLDTSARKVVSADVKTFEVVHDVSAPEHIPDNKGKPVLAVVELGAEDLNVEECVTTAGPNKPRLEQNMVFLLIPETVSIKTKSPDQSPLFADTSSPALKAIVRLRDIARTVLAMRKLDHNPQSHGIRPNKLDEDNFKERFHERENGLLTAVTESYTSLWYPSAGGHIVQKEIRTAGGEGGASVLEQIRKTLIEDGELITVQHGTQSVLMNLRKLFFKQSDVVALSKLHENFCCLRSWPILEAPTVLDQLIRGGVSRGIWCLFRMESEESTKPVEIYSQSTGELPFDIDLSKDYSIITPDGANQRRWTKGKGPDLTRVKDWVRQVVTEKQIATVSEVAEDVVKKFGEVPKKALDDTISKLVQEKRCMTYKGTKEQDDKPDLTWGTSAAFYIPEPNDLIITPKQAAEKGWITAKEKALSLSGSDGAKILIPLIGRIGSLYQRGGKSAIDLLDLTELELPKGGALRISLTNVLPESVKDLGELFEVLEGLVKIGDQTEAYLEINEPNDECPFVKELRKSIKGNRQVNERKKS